MYGCGRPDELRVGDDAHRMSGLDPWRIPVPEGVARARRMGAGDAEEVEVSLELASLRLSLVVTAHHRRGAGDVHPAAARGGMGDGAPGAGEGLVEPPQQGEQVTQLAAGFDHHAPATLPKPCRSRLARRRHLTTRPGGSVRGRGPLLRPG